MREQPSLLDQTRACKQLRTGKSAEVLRTGAGREVSGTGMDREVFNLNSSHILRNGK